MKSALRAALTLLAVFACTALVMALALDVDGADVRRWLMASKERPALVFAAIVGLLAVDSVLTVPTVATVVTAGYLLGPLWGALSSFAGVMLAGSICYWGGRVARSRPELQKSVGEVGPAPLLLARAAPMLPEVLSALAGTAKMPAARYYLYFGLGNLPFALLVAYAGSVSSLDRPWPAIIAGVAVPATGAAVLLWRRVRRAQ